MEKIQGYLLDGSFIPEGSSLKIRLTSGEVVEGMMFKPTKKEFRLLLGEAQVRVIQIADVGDVIVLQRKDGLDEI